MLFLKEFWNGNIAPGEGRYHSKKEYKEAWKLVEQTEDKLKELLTGEAWELFTSYQDAERTAGCISDTDIFIEGFRMGIMLMLDVLVIGNPKHS